MNNQYIKLLQDTFGDLKKVSPEKLQAFLSEIMKEVFNLRSLLQSENEEEKAAALKKGEELKALLENQMKSISETLGLTPKEIVSVGEIVTGYHDRKEKQKPASGNPQKNKKTINLVG